MKNHIEIIKKDKKIKIYGNQVTIDRAISFIENLDLTGIEEKDRLIIQRCIDDNKIGATILYDGNTVYSFNKIVDKYRKLQKSEDFMHLSDDLYKFFTNACGDIAHYDIVGYAHYYDNSFRKFEEDFLQHCDCNDRFSDVKRIFKKLKIGKFYEDRDKIDINKLSKKDLKNIIKQCGWDVVEKDNLWQLSIGINPNMRFCFQLDTSSLQSKDIFYCIIRYCVKFDVDEYIDTIVKERGESKSPTIRSIVNNTDIIYTQLKQFALDLSYYGRLAAQNLIEKEQDEIEMER
ncbi:MAG: hypothetical protein IJE89_06350 [Bacilli bacterium]|nr:hypothetical protein [Bacilli bacterium]